MYNDEMMNNYIQLSVNDKQFGFLISALERAAKLDYTGDSLRFDSDILDVAFSIILPETYKITLARLLAEKVADEEFAKGANNETV